MTYKFEKVKLMNDYEDLKLDGKLTMESLDTAVKSVEKEIEQRFVTFPEVKGYHQNEIYNICSKSELVCQFDESEGDPVFVLISSTPSNIPYIAEFKSGDRTRLDASIKRATSDFYSHIIRNAGLMGNGIREILLGIETESKFELDDLNEVIHIYFENVFKTLKDDAKVPDDFDIVDCITYAIVYNTPIDCIISEGIFMQEYNSLHLEEYAPLDNGTKE